MIAHTFFDTPGRKAATTAAGEAWIERTVNMPYRDLDQFPPSADGKRDALRIRIHA